MSRIVWDATGERYYESGVDHGVLYPLVGGVYQTGVAWNGLTSVSESPEGAEPTDLWADNIKYATLISAETFGGTIEAYTYPEEFAQCDGSWTPSNGIYVGQQDRVPFGFCYRTKLGNDAGIDAYKLHIVYNATAAPSEKSYETINDSPDAITFSWEINTTPVNVTGHKPTSLIVIDSDKCDADALATLENQLYGTGGSEPALPTPDEVVAIFGGTATYATLTALSVGGTLSPTFSSGTQHYTAPVSSDSATVSATAEAGATATIAVNGNVVTSGSAAGYEDGENTVVVTVTKPGTTTNVYTVYVTKS